jgi:hypothetical protein
VGGEEGEEDVVAGGEDTVGTCQPGSHQPMPDPAITCLGVLVRLRRRKGGCRRSGGEEPGKGTGWIKVEGGWDGGEESWNP